MRTWKAEWKRIQLMLASSLFAIAPFFAHAEDTGTYGFSPSDRRTGKPGFTLGIGGAEWTFGASMIANSEYSKDDFVDTPIPHSSYVDLGTKRIGPMIGLDLVKAWDLHETAPLLTTGAGLYFQRESRIVRSTATGWLWSQDEKTVIAPGISIGTIVSMPNTDRVKIGLEFHSIRGFSTSLKVILK